MKVELLSITSNSEELIAQAYGICTGKDSIPVENISKWIKQHHLTPIEQASASFHISGISRNCSHQLVRHRLFSFNQRSQRYCSEALGKVIIPPTIAASATAKKILRTVEEDAFLAYCDLLAIGIPKEDARYILPHGAETELVMAGNLRMFYEFLPKRLDPAAQWEVQGVARLILANLKIHAPHVFGDL